MQSTPKAAFRRSTASSWPSTLGTPSGRPGKQEVNEATEDEAEKHSERTSRPESSRPTTLHAHPIHPVTQSVSRSRKASSTSGRILERTSKKPLILSRSVLRLGFETINLYTTKKQTNKQTNARTNDRSADKLGNGAVLQLRRQRLRSFGCSFGFVPTHRIMSLQRTPRRNRESAAVARTIGYRDRA